MKELWLFYSHLLVILKLLWRHHDFLFCLNKLFTHLIHCQFNICRRLSCTHKIIHSIYRTLGDRILKIGTWYKSIGAVIICAWQSLGPSHRTRQLVVPGTSSFSMNLALYCQSFNIARKLKHSEKMTMILQL